MIFKFFIGMYVIYVIYGIYWYFTIIIYDVFRDIYVVFSILLVYKTRTLKFVIKYSSPSEFGVCQIPHGELTHG